MYIFNKSRWAYRELHGFHVLIATYNGEILTISPEVAELITTTAEGVITANDITTWASRYKLSADNARSLISAFVKKGVLYEKV